MTELKSDGTTNYVDNKHFYQLMVERSKQVKEATAAGKPVPRISEEIGKIILDISTNLSYRRNFIRYSYREEMIGDGVENCIRYLDRFDCEKYKNPFGYFTQICFFAFVRRITGENKQWDIKKRAIEKHGVDWDAYARNEFDIDEDFFPVQPPEMK